jgi:TfoX/Sxy family transcriptional regulator of competence genes
MIFSSPPLGAKRPGEVGVATVWAKSTEKMIRTFEGALPADAGVERKKMFGCPAGFVNGSMFAGLHENRIVLRLPDADRERLRRDHRAKPFGPMPGRMMKEWIVVPAGIAEDGCMLAKLIKGAFAHTASLPPKAKKKSKKKRRDPSGSSFRSPAGENAVDGRDQLVRPERLCQGCLRAESFGDVEIHQVLRAAAGDRDDLHAGRALERLADRLDAFLVRHEDIGDDEIGLPIRQQRQALPPVFRLEQRMAARAEHAQDELAHRQIVIDHQNCRHSGPCRRCGAGEW